MEASYSAETLHTTAGTCADLAWAVDLAEGVQVARSLELDCGHPDASLGIGYIDSAVGMEGPCSVCVGVGSLGLENMVFGFDSRYNLSRRDQTVAAAGTELFQIPVQD